MSHYGIHHLVTELVENSPKKAADILTRCCEEREKVLQEVTTFLLQSRPRQYEASNPPANIFDITFARPVSPSSHGSHHTGSPPPLQRPPRRSSSTTYPFSRSGTASSVTSHSTRNENGSGEYILLPTLVGTKVVEQKVRMKSAPIKYSVIRDDVVGKRNLDDSSNLNSAKLIQVEVPHRASGGIQIVPTSWSIHLTWRRPHSDSTHSTMFYVVSRDVLDIDMYLGYQDSREDSPDYQPTIVPQPHAHQQPNFQDYKQEPRPYAPTPPSPSFHRSAMTYDGSARTSPIHRREEQPHMAHLVEPFISRQQSYARAMEGHQPSPAPTVLDAHIEHPQPVRTNNAPTTHVHDADPNRNADRIRVSLLWEATTLNVWLNLKADGEAFYKAFQQQASEQHKDGFERATVVIKMKKDKAVPDKEAYALSLDEEDLEADWETTRGWLEANRRDKSPQIYGEVKIEDR